MGVEVTAASRRKPAGLTLVQRMAGHVPFAMKVQRIRDFVDDKAMRIDNDSITEVFAR
jgi:hypothetical protein